MNWKWPKSMLTGFLKQYAHCLLNISFTGGNMEKKIRILNLYAGIGGNRKLWPNDEIEVTAVELNPEIAKIYQDFFPKDKVIIGDAHQYLLDHYKEFEFIWSSPPCQTHSICNNFLHNQGIIRYPDMNLYQEIIFLKRYAKCKWVVENVKPYYEPLIKPQIAGRHRLWANFHITNFKTPHNDIGTMNRQASSQTQQVACKKPLIERNAVYSPLGLHIFNCAFKEKQQTLTHTP